MCGSRLTGEQAGVSHDYSSSTPSGETRMIGNWSKQTFPSTNKSEIIWSNWKDFLVNGPTTFTPPKVPKSSVPEMQLSECAFPTIQPLLKHFELN